MRYPAPPEDTPTTLDNRQPSPAPPVHPSIQRSALRLEVVTQIFSLTRRGCATHRIVGVLSESLSRLHGARSKYSPMLVGYVAAGARSCTSHGATPRLQQSIQAVLRSASPGNQRHCVPAFRRSVFRRPAFRCSASLRLDLTVSRNEQSLRDVGAGLDTTVHVFLPRHLSRVTGRPSDRGSSELGPGLDSEHWTVEWRLGAPRVTKRARNTER